MNKHTIRYRVGPGKVYSIVINAISREEAIAIVEEMEGVKVLDG